METLVPIGDSFGVRIPNALAEQAGLENQLLELRITPEGLLVRPVRDARHGWAGMAGRDRPGDMVDGEFDWSDAALAEFDRRDWQGDW